MTKHKKAIAIQKSFSTCAYCQRNFQQTLFVYEGKERFARNKTCSHTCSLKLQNKRRKENNPSFYWSEEEENFLVEQIKKNPPHVIYAEWNDNAIERGWETRPYHQICSKAQRLAQLDPRLSDCYVAGKNSKKKRIHPSKDNWSLQDLKRILKIRRYERVLRWVHKKGLDYKDLSTPQKRYYAISRRALRKFASLHPEEFWGITQKDLAKVLPKKLASSIYKINRERQPTNGRALPVVRLDTGDVYRSGTAAATALSLNVSATIECAKSDKPMFNGMDFYRFDYPTYWVPPDVREKFNYVAGKVLYSLYLDICNVTGYQKQSCLLVSARLAVQTTLVAFRRREKLTALSREVEPIETIAEYWRELFFKKLSYCFHAAPSVMLNKINYIISKKVFRNCYAIAKGDATAAKEYVIDFSNYYIKKEIEKFYKNSYLPRNYTPTDKLQHADLWANIYGSLNIKLWIGKEENGTLKAIEWVHIAFMHFCRKHKIKATEEDTPLLQAYNQDWKQHNTQTEKSDCSTELELLLNKAKKSYPEEQYEQLELFVTLKLEDASDAEIVECMGISSIDFPRMLSMLRSIANQKI